MITFFMRLLLLLMFTSWVIAVDHFTVTAAGGSGADH
jgi:hypothetical protein